MNKNAINALFYAVVVAFGGFIFGLDAAVISGTVRFITAEFNLSDLQIGTVVSAPGWGVLFALLVAGYVSDKFGRKKALIMVAGLYFVSAVTSALAPNYICLVAARFLGGLAFTSLSLASMYIGEIAPAKWRGKLVSFNQFNIVVGLSGAYFVNYFILTASQSGAEWVSAIGIEQHTWRWMLGSEIVPALVWLVLLLFVPESPRWLVFNKRSADAKIVLAKVSPTDDLDEQIKGMEASMHKSHDSRSIGSQLKELFSKRMRTVLFIGTAIAAVQPITGINAILFYAPTVFEQLGMGTDAAFMQAVWVGVISVVFTTLALFLIDRAGRRPMLIWGLVWLISSLAICSYGFKTATYTLSNESLESAADIVDVALLAPMVGKTYTSDTEFKDALKEHLGEEVVRDNSSVLIQAASKINAKLILFGIMSFIAAFQFSVGPIMWVLFSEIFPTALRGVAIPAFAFITSVLSVFVQQFFPVQLAAWGASTVFLSYAIMATTGLVALFKTLPETKNKSIEEIEEELTT